MCLMCNNCIYAYQREWAGLGFWSSALRRVSLCTVAVLLWGVSAGAFAQSPALASSRGTPSGETISHPWVLPSPRAAETYFTNLQDGGVYEAPFVARFGLSMRGLVPAGHLAGRAGHHHLLINQPLPLDFKKPLPFTGQYIHFGKGQMEMVVDLPPGQYELRLLLADQGHIPYFVYSKPLKLTVSKQNKNVTAASVQGAPRIELLNVADHDMVRAPFRLQFHASGYNISNMAAQVPGTGHFRLTMDRAGHKPEVLDFTTGQTEAWLSPPAGDYTLRLELLGNAPGERTESVAKPVTLSVAAR